MSGPDEPDWGFPEVDPASTELPAEDDVLEALETLSSRAAGEGPFDTGSDAWWRAQASAQREAAATEPPVVPSPPPAPPLESPPPLVRPQVLLPEPLAPPLPVASPEPPASPAPTDPAPAPLLPVAEQAAAPQDNPLDAQWTPQELPGVPTGPPAEAPAPPAPPVPPGAVVPPTPPIPPTPPAPPPPAGLPVPPPPPFLRPAARPGARVPARPVPPAAPAARPDVPPVPPRVAEPPVEQDEPPRLPSYPSAQTDLYEGLRYQEGPPPVGRRRAVLGALLAVLGVVIGIGLLYVFRHDGDSGPGPTVALPVPTNTATQQPSSTPTPTARPSASVAPVVRATTPPPVVLAPVQPVLVLNNSRVHGLADRSAAKFRAGGWPVSGTGNYSGGVIAQTTVYYAPGQLGSAQRFAKQFDIGRVLPRFRGLPGKGLTVVLTRDYR